MTKEIFERAWELDKEISILFDLECLFINSNENRVLVLQNNDDGHKVIDRAVILEEAKEVCLSAIRKLSQAKREEFEKL